MDLGERIVDELPVARLGVDPHECLPGQIGAGDRFLPGQRVVPTHEDHIRLSEDLADIQIPMPGADDRNAELDLPRLHKLVNPPKGLIVELYGDARTFRGELTQDGWQVVIGDGRQTGECQPLLLGLAVATASVIGFRKMGEVALHLRQQRLSLLGEQHVASAADHKLHAEIRLDLADAMTERRLRQIEIRRRAVETAELRDGDERLQPQIIRPHAALSGLADPAVRSSTRLPACQCRALWEVAQQRS